jgi:hypothetical protein
MTMDLHTFKKFFQRFKAQGMVEFALVLPLLLLLIFGIIEAGRLLFLYSAVMSSSREAVRYGSASGDVIGLTTYYEDCTGIQDAAMRIGKFAGVSAGDVTISYDHGPGTGTFATCPPSGSQTVKLGDRVVVQVITNWTPLLPLVNFSGFPITSQSSRTIIKDVQIQGTPPPPIQPTVAFLLSDQTVNEGDGQIQVSMRLSTSTVQTVSVPFSVSGTAANGVDFTVSGSPVVIPPGTTLGQIIVNLNDDDIDEDAETVVLTMGTPAHANKGTPNVHTMTIEDNDDPPAVSFLLAAQGFAEDVDGIAMLKLSNPSVRDITVDYSVAGVAQGGFDYSITASPITIPAMDTSFPIVIDVTDDLIDEVDEDFVITLVAVTNGTVGFPNVHTYTIFDNDDPPLVFFTWVDQSVEEKDISINVEMQLSIESSKVITVPFSVGGTASQGSDYSIDPSPIVFTPGMTTASIPIDIYDNADVKDDIEETIILTLLEPVNATPGSPSVHTLKITNTPVIPIVSFSSSSQTSNNPSMGTLSVIVVLSDAASVEVVVPFSVSGTATQNLDYSIDNSPVTIPAGGAKATIRVTMYKDAIDEYDETIVITMGIPTNATKGNPNVHTITMIDNDPEPQLSFTSNGQMVDEDFGTVTITAQLNVMSGKDVTVPFNAVGTAELGVGKDYMLTASPVMIMAGNTFVDITLDVLDDGDQEPDEDVIITLEPPTNATLGLPAQFTLTIQDNEPQNCPFSTGLPAFGTGANKNVLTWTLQSQDPLVPVNLTEVTIHWPAESSANVTSITFGGSIYSGNAPPIFLAVNSPTPLWSGAFDTRHLVFLFDINPNSVAGDIYQLGATFEGCPPVGESIPSG